SSSSSNSSSVCRSRRHASPRQQGPFPSQPTPRSGDFRHLVVNLTHFFPPVEKVGLEIRLVGSRLRHRIVLEKVRVVLVADMLVHWPRLPAPEALDRLPRRGEGAGVIDRDQDLHHL